MGFWSGLFIGMIVAWLFLPEPAFIRDWWARVTSLVRPTAKPTFEDRWPR